MSHILARYVEGLNPQIEWIFSGRYTVAKDSTGNLSMRSNLTSAAAFLFAALASTSAVLASPVEGMWPSESRGAVQPKPKWIIVVPLVREASGVITAWNRNDPWVRKWVVPKTIGGGIRTVTVTGDAEDVRNVSGEQFDNMDAAALRRLTSKYGASALAVVVYGGQGEAAVAAWTPGQQASWDVTKSGEDPKDGAMRILGDLFSGASIQSSRLKITGVRTIAGIDQYRLEAKDWSVMDSLRASRSLEVVETFDSAGRPTAIVKVTSGRAIEDIIGGITAQPVPQEPSGNTEASPVSQPLPEAVD
jgi:hypothetical protein